MEEKGLTYSFGSIGESHSDRELRIKLVILNRKAKENAKKNSTHAASQWQPSQLFYDQRMCSWYNFSVS